MSKQPIIIKKIIGKTVKAIRMKKGISQEDLAFSCDVDRSYISLIEVGKNEPSVSKIFEICEGLKIKPSDLIRMVEIEYEKHKKPKAEQDSIND